MSYPSDLCGVAEEGNRIGTHPQECKRPCGGRGGTPSRSCHVHGVANMARNTECRRRWILQAQCVVFGCRWIDGALALM